MTASPEIRLCLIAWLLCAGTALARPFPDIPRETDSDLTYFADDGVRTQGVGALEKMQDADLVIWCAGNQFVAIPDVVAAFQKISGNARVGVITLPPELELRAIQAGGWRYQGRDFPGRPDIYGSVSVASLQATGRIRQYVAYAHNELQLMVARGNPKGVQDLHDLVRPDLRVVLPNPIDEGIMKEYGEPILVHLGLWNQLSGDADPCRSCERAGHVYFTSVHHRESPARVASGKSDVALVWSTEVEEARRDNLPIEGVSLPPAQSARDAATYFAGALVTGHSRLAREYLAFLVTPAAQTPYVSHGFKGVDLAQEPIRSLPLSEAASE